MSNGDAAAEVEHLFALVSARYGDRLTLEQLADLRRTVEGIVLLAPFLGTRGLIAEVTRAGGLHAWQPGAGAAEDEERRFLAWLREYRAGDPAWPRVHLGYGTEDRYAPASAILAPLLPASRVVAVPGGHDWDTWLRLWDALLDRGVLKTRNNEPQMNTDTHR